MNTIKSVTENRADARQQWVVQVLAQVSGSAPQGAGLEGLHAALPCIPRRTLQRLLADLVQNGQLLRVGKGRATVYQPVQPVQSVLMSYEKTGDDYAYATIREGNGDDYTAFMPLSDTSRHIIAQLRRPLAARVPVSYERSWLEAYKPNKTFYLDENTRTQLRRLGDTGLTESPMGTYGRDILDRLLIDLSWASSQLEGNTYSRLDTERLIRHGQAAVGKDTLETQMILNHKQAIEMLVEYAGESDFNRYTFLNLHGLLSENLMPDPAASGRLRLREVQISGTVYLPTAMPQVIEDCFTLLLQKAQLINDPFEQAFFILVHIPYLQAFEDVNKRVARIGANIAFIKNNLCPLTFIEVPERAYVEALLAVYELRNVDLLRDVFVWAYERSTQRYMQVKKTLVEPEPMRFKYRQQLHRIVGDVVRAGQTQYTPMVENSALSIEPADRAVFIAIALDDIRRLHEGILARYRLTPGEFRVWKERINRVDQ